MNNTTKKAAAFVTLAAGTAATIHTLNRLIDQNADSGLLNKANTLTYNWRLCPVTYTKTGSGSPVLLLHELSACSSSFEWKHITASLSRQHTVYILDLPGCGLSDKPYLTYTNFFFVELITDFIKTIIQNPCDVIATGISASIAITSCGIAGSLFKKLLLVNPVSPQQLSLVPGKRSRIRKTMLSAPIIGTLLYHILISREMLTKEFSHRLFYHDSHVDPLYIETYYESGHRDSSRGRFLMASIAGNYVYFPIDHALQSIDNDIVIIGGEHQEYIQDTIRAYCRMNPAIEAVTVKDSRHLPQLEVPEDFLKQISVYLSE